MRYGMEKTNKPSRPVNSTSHFGKTGIGGALTIDEYDSRLGTDEIPCFLMTQHGSHKIQVLRWKTVICLLRNRMSVKWEADLKSRQGAMLKVALF